MATDVIFWAINYALLLGILFGVVHLVQKGTSPSRPSLFGRRRRR